MLARNLSQVNLLLCDKRQHALQRLFPIRQCLSTPRRCTGQTLGALELDEPIKVPGEVRTNRRRVGLIAAAGQRGRRAFARAVQAGLVAAPRGSGTRGVGPGSGASTVHQQGYEFATSSIRQIARTVPQTLARVLLQLELVVLLDGGQGWRGTGFLPLGSCAAAVAGCRQIFGGERETPVLELGSVVLQLEQVAVLLRAPTVVQPGEDEFSVNREINGAMT